MWGREIEGGIRVHAKIEALKFEREIYGSPFVVD